MFPACPPCNDVKSEEGFDDSCWSSWSKCQSPNLEVGEHLLDTGTKSHGRTQWRLFFRNQNGLGGSLSLQKGKSTRTKPLSSRSKPTRTRSYKEGERETENRKCKNDGKSEKNLSTSGYLCIFTGSLRFTSQSKYYTQHANQESMNEQCHRLFWFRLHSQPDGRLLQIETQSRS